MFKNHQGTIYTYKGTGLTPGTHIITIKVSDGEFISTQKCSLNIPSGILLCGTFLVNIDKIIK